MTAQALAGELSVSVRTIYRDLDALSAAGIPVYSVPGPHGGCQLIDDYRFPLRALRAEEAEALLILGVPNALRDIGLDAAASAAQRQIRISAGPDRRVADASSTALVHLDMPRWFASPQHVPHLRALAEAVRRGRRVELTYRRGGGQRAPGSEPAAEGDPAPRMVAPLGLVNKAGTWYLVAADRAGQFAVFRADRISALRTLLEPFDRPQDFDLAVFWERWSGEFEAGRPRLQVRVRASPAALSILPEIFGDAVRPVLAGAGPADDHGWQELTLSFEHERAAAHRLAGFGGLVEVLKPQVVREYLQEIARGTLRRYSAGPLADAPPPVS
jgi:predicted DNA-binding transcriptional regulator YafY